MHDPLRLRERLAGALAAAREARAPDRVLALLQGAYRALESTRFVDDDMIRWAEAGLAAWHRWSSLHARVAHRLLVVDGAGELAPSLAAIAHEMQVAHIEVARSKTATLEALARRAPTAIIFDQDETGLAPSTGMLEW